MAVVAAAAAGYLSDKLRVIECRNGLQWILQRRRSRCPNSWRGIKYCRTKEVLMRYVHTADAAANVHTADAAAMEILCALPDLFPERPRRRRRGEAAADYAQLSKVTEVSEVTEVTDQCRLVPEPEQT
jgi:hypothetical protein